MSGFPHLGLTEADVVDYARAVQPVDLERMLLSLERILEVITDGETVTEAARLPGQLQVIKKNYMDELSGLMADLSQKGVTPKEFEKKIRPLIADNFKKAYEAGSGRKTTEGDSEWLARAVDSEVGHARGLAAEVAAGASLTPDVRAANYAASLDGVSWNGKVESQPEGTVIHWKLGLAEHCDDCILLAAHSPYDKYSLPATPRSGDTQCMMNCKCSLVFARGKGAGKPKSGVFGIDSYLGSDEVPVPRQGKGLEDWLSPGPVPDGLRVATSAEQLAINGMWNEVNYQRRLISQLDPALAADDYMAAMDARATANSELIDYVEENGIYDKPPFSVDEVITARELPLVVERDIFELGLGGDVLESEAVSQEMAKLVARYEREIGKKLAGGK